MRKEKKQKKQRADIVRRRKNKIQREIRMVFIVFERTELTNWNLMQWHKSIEFKVWVSKLNVDPRPKKAGGLDQQQTIY